MYAARIFRPADKTMLILPIPLPVTAEHIETSIRRRLATVTGLEFVDVVELSDEFAARVQATYDQAGQECNCGHNHGPEDEGEGIPDLYLDGFQAMAMLLKAMVIIANLEKGRP